MRVHTKVEFRWVEDGDDVRLEVVNEEGFDYEGPVELCGGGPSSEQRQAASAQANLSNQAASNSASAQKIVQEQYGKIDPFATQRMKEGLPFFNNLTDYASGTNAQAFAPEQAQLERTLKNYGTLPSGFATQARTNLQAQRARGFDQAMVQNLMANEQAKNNAAGLLVGQQQVANPLGWSSSGMQGNQSIMQAPLASPGIGGLLGGLAGGAMSAIPF